MFELFCLWFGAAFRNQQDLLLENLALRQGLKPALILDVLRGAEAPFFRVTGTSRSVPLSFHHVGLWIGVEKLLALFRETVKI